MKKLWIVWLSAAMIVMSACGIPQNQESASGEGNVELTVSAAASLQEALKIAGDVYMQEHPTVKIVFNFASSGTLQKQIEEGAPVDVFISAAAKQMDALEEKDLIKKGTRADLLKNALVVVVPQDAPKPQSLKDLSNEQWNPIAIGEPDSVPAGTYAKEAMMNQGVYESITDRVVFGKNVKEVLSWIETGNAQVGFVYRSDAVVSKNAVVAFEVEDSLHKPIIYPGAVIEGIAHEKEAQNFLEFLKTETAVKVFEEKGYEVIVQKLEQ